ncbi:MAG: sugar phosphate nucleotidyltransferase [Candidatus Woesearchaeota archaeon]
MKKKISITINEKMINDIDSIIDNVFIRNRSQAIEYLVNNSLGGNKTAVILSGGPEKKLFVQNAGYRPVLKVNGSTVVEKAVKKLRQNGFKKIFIVARHKLLTKIFEILKEGSGYGVNIEYIEEKVSNGSADSLRLLKGRLQNNFLVVFSDIVFDKINLEELWNDHIKQNAVATLLLTTTNNPETKGIVKVEGSKILEFVQKPRKSESYLVFSPIFVCSPEIFDFAGKSLEQNVFPKVATNHLLNSHVSSEKEIHIHGIHDLNMLKGK